MSESAAEPTTPEVPSVEEAWSAVMGDVTHLGKDSRNAAQGFNFRGIDAVMNLVGPILRKHGVSVIPSVQRIERSTFTTNKGTVMRETLVQVSYTIHGPAGDTIYGSAWGEASDAGDKSTPKAMSVAMRTFLLQALCLPTDEPDPDLHVVERGIESPKAGEIAATVDGLAKATDPEAVKRVRTWAEGKGYLGEPVTVGDNTMPLSRLFDTTLARLGDTTADAAAEKVLADSLGATPVETSTEEAKA